MSKYFLRRHNRHRYLKLVLLSFTAITSGTAEAEDLPLERVYASPSLSGPSPRELKLSPNGRFATLLRDRAGDRQKYDLWAYDTTTGHARMLLDSDRFGAEDKASEEEKMRLERARIAGARGIINYEWSPDSRSILVPLQGDIFIANIDGRIRRLTETPETELDAQVSSTGRYVSFVREKNLFVTDLESGTERRVTHDGAGAVSWGSAEFIAQEEMGRYVGHWWSPDDDRIAVARVDESEVHIRSRAAIGSDGSRVYQQRYPLAGTANAKVELFIMPTIEGEAVKADLGSDLDIYVARVSWTPDGEALLVQRQSRDQKRLDLLRVDPKNGKASLLFTESASTWVNLHNNLRVLRDGSIIWSSERTGYSHLYRWNNGMWTQLTEGDWEVFEVKGIDEKSKRIYFTGGLDDPNEQHLYWTRYDKPSAPIRVTDRGWDNLAQMDRTGRRAIITRSNPVHPSQVYLADENGKRIAWIEENKLDESHAYAPYLDSHTRPEFGTIKGADGTLLPYKMLLPKLEPGKRYPVLVNVYGGPTSSRVQKKWDDPVVFQHLVDEGWIVFTVDGRGTPKRGRKYLDALHLNFGSVEVEDQLAGVNWLKQKDFVDSKRISVYGWSYGGFMVLKLLEAAPGIFAAGVAGAPVSKWELYDTHYTERYLGNPARDPKPYERGNAIADARKISDPLLIIHGMADDNVLFDHSAAIISVLQDQRKSFEMMVYPGAAHSIGSEDWNIHRWKVMKDFLNRHVKKNP